MFNNVYHLLPTYTDYVDMLKLMQHCGEMTPKEFGMRKKWNKPRKR